MTATQHPSGHEGLRLDLGAYVLGALSPDEARAVEVHLAACVHCRAELASLETLPALLDAVPLARAGEIAHDDARSPDYALGPAGAPRELLARVARRRRARSAVWAGSLAAAAAGFFAAGIAAGPVVGTALGGGPAPSARPSATAPAPAQTLTLASESGAQVDLALVRKGWGTELDLTCHGMPNGGVFTVWVVGADGSSQQAASWSSAGYASRAVLTGATSIQLASIRTVEIRDAAQQTIASTSVG
ncbi:zf-HC2 domain-containing protein [Sinomonas sp. ASV486]|uniref:anti-sigma factor family protein n=1 Tax=Sinomonas sp. ASV486 TaxID=3051170 RepID=UPI0027DE33B7|nr:zf-HC2 domain-containing protein [Sinomonas sp. ASV486]MDQ4488960.1 zf-HC2 domain-containing protein [Sinomonas sp. ASV486]